MMKTVKARLHIININLDEHDFFPKFNAFCKCCGIDLLSCSVEQNKYFCNFHNNNFWHAFEPEVYVPPMDIHRGIITVEYNNIYREDRKITLRNGDVVCFTGIDISILSPEYINENNKILSNE